MNMHSQELEDKAKQTIQLPVVFIANFLYTNINLKVTKVNIVNVPVLLLCFIYVPHFLDSYLNYSMSGEASLVKY